MLPVGRLVLRGHNLRRGPTYSAGAQNPRLGDPGLLDCADGRAKPWVHSCPLAVDLAALGPVDPRTVRWVGVTDRLRVTWPERGPSWASSMDTATRPTCSIGDVMVVSGGLQKSAPKMSSQPTML